MKPKILIVDDEKPLRDMLAKWFGKTYDCQTAPDAAEAMKVIAATSDLALMITDFKMPGESGLDLAKKAKAANPNLAVIILTAHADVNLVIEAMRDGVDDFFQKPVTDLSQLELRMQKALKTAALEREVSDLKSQLSGEIENFTGKSPAMEKVYRLIRKVAPTNATVLVEGPSGTGKELVARALHNLSPRAKGPFVAVECAALSKDLLESELFGYMPGTFTGGLKDGKAGCFEAANGGTLFLDEISSMPLLLQGKLLRVLQEREIRRVGGTKDIPVDVRVIAASNANLEQAVVKGKFRSDLYYRFAVITIDIPPLRERKEDILPLAKHFIKFETPEGSPVPGIDPETARVLTGYSWPGNVRELENAMKHALTFLTEGDITPDLLPPKITQHAAPAEAPAAAETDYSGNTSLKSFLKQKEKEYIEHILVATGGDKAKAADTLKVNLSTLYRKPSDEPAK